MTKILYITYDGILEPLGQSQVLRYLEQLSIDNEIIIISFEKARDWRNIDQREAMRSHILTTGIRWIPIRYHKKPSSLATFYDVIQGTLVGIFVVIRYRVSIVHARSYVASVMALMLKKLFRLKFIFDMRGFWADERVDGGLWSREGLMFRVAKWFERRFFLDADHVVSLTHAGLREIHQFDYLQNRMPPVTIIPTCADLNYFKPLPRAQAQNSFVLGYVGSAGTWYMFDKVLACFVKLLSKRPNSRFLIVNRGDHAFIRERLVASGLTDSAVELTVVTHAEIPQVMARMDAGIFFIKPLFSKQASAPTKLAEFLGCGIPCLANTGVGDMADVLEGEKVGVALSSFSEEAMATGISQLLAIADDPGVRERCIAAAQKHFSLDEGVRRYASIYEQLESRA